MTEAQERLATCIACGELARIAELESKLSDAHCLLQGAYAAVDPEAFPELFERLGEAIEPCGLPQCQHVARLDERIRVALTIADEHGQIDGAHHKAWVIDQMCRVLLGDDYAAFVLMTRAPGHEWTEGIAP